MSSFDPNHDVAHARWNDEIHCAPRHIVLRKGQVSLCGKVNRSDRLAYVGSWDAGEKPSCPECILKFNNLCKHNSVHSNYYVSPLAAVDVVAKRKVAIVGWEPYDYEAVVGGLLIKGAVLKTVTRGKNKGAKTARGATHFRTVIVTREEADKEESEP